MPQLSSPGERHDRSAPPIEAIDLSASYDGRVALEGLNFCLESGSRVAVVGPNGAGKTTLFKVLAGILPPTAGRVHVHGHDPGGHICVAYVPQRNEVDWAFPVSVADVVMMGRIREIGLFRWPRSADWSIVEKSLSSVGLEGVAKRQIGELSGGQQQRVFIAQAVAQHAQIVLLDEPLSGLDVPSQQAILDILDDLQTQGITILVATHDLNLAAEHFDRVMLLNRRLIAFGEAEEILTKQILLEAYGASVHMIEEPGVSALTDTHHEGRE
ncbi:MAG: metal ABC transporter ATP-binding protein [Anaerolineales bacterium]